MIALTDNVVAAAKTALSCASEPAERIRIMVDALDNLNARDAASGRSFG
ncbi:hypothetical protein [Mesorhizobium sp.]|nr:hypothetical protein [Mesorhizobium sp.]